MKKPTRLLIVVAGTLLIPPTLRAQQEVTPGPAEEQAPAVVTGGEQQAPAEEPSAGPIPDTRPLSGAEELRVETPGRTRNFVIPSLRISAYGDSNQTILATGTSGVEMTGSVVGALALQRVTRKNQFVLDYLGGGLIYLRDSELNATMHQLGFAETFQGRRWGFMIGDRLGYLPESSFGFGGFGSSLGFGGGFGGGLGRLNPGLDANQTLFSGRGPRITNNALTQIQYTASSRSSFTLGGSYGFLRFREPGYIESDFGMGTVGYNYSINRRDTVAVTYGLSIFRFQGIDYHIDGHYAQLAFSRRVTGRLAFQLAGGPQLIISRSPALGTDNQVYWTAHSALDYQLPRTSLNFSYGHYTTSGSGLLLGASTDQLRGSMGLRVTRNWTWSISPGYARNSRLRQGPAVSTASSYSSVFASTGLNRAIGRYTDFSFDYTLQEQWSDALTPSGINTGSSYLRHYFGVSLTWHTERIAMN